MTDQMPFEATLPEGIFSLLKRMQRLGRPPYLSGKSDRWLAAVSERTARAINRLPPRERDRIRRLPDAQAIEYLRTVALPNQGVLSREDYVIRGEQILYEPGGDSNYSGQWVRVQYPSGYVDMVVGPSPFPDSRQRVWAGSDPGVVDSQEVLVKAENEAAVQEWATEQGYGDMGTDEEGNPVFLWETPVDFPIPIVITQAVIDPGTGDVTTPPVLSTEFHVNVQVR